MQPTDYDNQHTPIRWKFILAAVVIVFLAYLIVPLPISRPMRMINADLNGTQWELVRLNGKQVVPETTVTLTISEDRFSGFAGCNRYSGSPMRDRYAITMLSCGDSTDQQEERFLGTLALVGRYQIAGDRLRMFSIGNIFNLIFVRWEES